MTTSDGKTRRFQDGDVLLVEDTTGVVSSCVTTSLCCTLLKHCCVGRGRVTEAGCQASGQGHKSRAVDGKPRKSILVKLRCVAEAMKEMPCSRCIHRCRALRCR